MFLAFFTSVNFAQVIDLIGLVWISRKMGLFWPFGWANVLILFGILDFYKDENKRFEGA